MIEYEALKNCNKAILLNPQNILEHKKRGVKNADLGNIKEAVEDYNRAILINPTDISAYFSRGTLKADLGDFEGAKKDFETAQKLNNRITKSHNLIKSQINPERLIFLNQILRSS